METTLPFDAKLRATLDGGAGQVLNFIRSPKKHHSRETELMAAVLDRAVEDWKYPSGHPLHEDVREWLYDGDTRYLFSFIPCCEVLGLEPEAVQVAFDTLEERGSM